ncbi:MAG: hypothetical protein K2J77_08610 [Oscillospiraceae bacterium]|nr:hypothetical protein [Oscillospiraceae bacterium]
MERICRECGSLVNGDAKFCPVCGKVMERAVELTKQQGDVMPPVVAPIQQNTQSANNVGSSAGYGAPQYGSGGVPQNIQQPTRPIGGYEQMTTGEWILTIIVGSFFGIISLILNIVWGFGSTTPEPKRSFCKAMFIVNIIQTVLSFILGFIFFAMAIGAGYSSSYYY